MEHVVCGFKDVALHLHNTGKDGDKILDEHPTNVYVLGGNKICRIDTFISDCRHDQCLLCLRTRGILRMPDPRE